jgi:hypothetical protein
VVGPKRTPALPDYPTIAESGVPGFGYNNWYAVFMPGATPKPLGQICDRHARHAPGVVSGDAGLIHLGDDKHAGGAGAMGLLGHLH